MPWSTWKRFVQKKNEFLVPSYGKRLTTIDVLEGRSD